MGEEKQEETKPVEVKAEEKKEEKAAEEEKKEEKKEEKAAEEEKPSPPPPPPPPVVLFVDLHCVGCAKKIERCLLKCKGVEEVEANMVTNQVKIKGMVDPQALCTRIKKKTLRSAKVISPPPPTDAPNSADSTPSQVVASQVDGVTTVELLVNMHCEACAQQLRKKILKMRGVQAAETELSSGTVKVTGTMTGNKIVDYIYRRTGKLAKVIPPPPPPPPPPAPAPEEEKKDDGEKQPEEEKKGDSNAEEKKEGEQPAAEAAAIEKKDDGSKEGDGGGEEPKKEGETVGPNMEYVGPDDMIKRMMYWNGGYNNFMRDQEEMVKRTMMMVPPPWTVPVYVVERPPPAPQFFSDENPNACCIS